MRFQRGFIVASSSMFAMLAFLMSFTCFSGVGAFTEKAKPACVAWQDELSGDYFVRIPVREKKTREVFYTVKVPVRETRTKTIAYTVMNHVREQRTRIDPVTGEIESYTVVRHVPEHKEKSVDYVVTNLVPERRSRTVEYETVRFETIRVTR